MSGLIEVTGPTVEPISRTEARDHLRLDDGVDDRQIHAYITAARQWCENYTGRVFITRTLRQLLDANPYPEIGSMREGKIYGHQNQISNASGVIEIAAVPVISVTSIKYYSDDDTETTWAASNYYVDSASDVAKIVLRDSGSWPTDLRAANGLEINFTAGYGATPNSVPDPVRIAILQYMTFLYEHRGDFERYPPPSPPSVISSLLNPYKVMRFGGANPYTRMLRSGIG